MECLKVPNCTDSLVEPFINIKDSKSELDPFIRESYVLSHDLEALQSCLFTKEELVNIISIYGDRYDESVVRKIAGIAMDSEGHIETEIFVKSYLKRKNELLMCVTHQLAEIQNIENEIENCREQAETQLNSISEPKVTFHIVSVHPLVESQSKISTVYIEIVYDNQRIETPVIPILNNFADISRLYSFIPTNPDGVFQIQLYTSQEKSMNITLGTAELKLSRLSDQVRRRFQIDLTPPMFTIILEAQWIFDKQDVYSTYTEQLRKDYEKAKEQYLTFKLELDAINKPFEQTSSEGVSGLFSTGMDYISDLIERITGNFTLSQAQSSIKFCLVFYFILASMGGFARTTYLDIMIALYGFWLSLRISSFVDWSYIVLTGLFLLAMFFDYLWLEDQFKVTSWTSMESDMENISKILSLISFLWKAFSIIFFWKLRRDAIRRHKSLSAAQFGISGD